MEQGGLTRADVLRTIRDYLRRDGGQSDKIIVPESGGPFFEYEDEWEEKEEEEDDGYYDALGHAFDDACSRLELIFPPPHRVDEMVERFVRYRNQADMDDRAAVTVRGVLTNVHRERNGLRNDLLAAREATAAAACNEDATRAREVEAVAAHDNGRTNLTQVRNA